jgi:TolB-like protein
MKYIKLKLSKTTLWFIAGCIGILLNGCSSPKTDPVRYFEERPSLSYLNSYAAEQLFLDIERAGLGRDAILVTTFVEMDDLMKSSSFARLVAEQMSSRLSQKRLKVRELRFSPNRIYVDKSGEFILSREVVDIAAEARATVVVTGTYLMTDSTVYIVARAIEARSGLILGSVNYEVVRDYRVMELFH